MTAEQSFAQVLEESGRLVYTTKGVSMRPLLRQGRDVVMIEKTGEPYKKYDTVLFLRDNGQYVLHRILKILDDGYWIVGDNCDRGEMVRENQILGVMTSVKRGKKIVHVNDWKYRFYTHVWCDVYPLRFALIRVRHFAYRCYRLLKTGFADERNK